MTLASVETFPPPPRAAAPLATQAAGGPRGVLERARLAGEIVAAYLRTQRALGSAPIVDVLAGLRARPASRQGREELSDQDALAEARRLGRAVVRTLALLPGDARCLVRSLVLTRLLARRGIPARVVIGTRTEPGFGAHAWVEHRGRPVLWPGDGSFGRLVEL